MAEQVTAAFLRSKAEGLKIVAEGDAKVFDRDTLAHIVADIRRDLAAAANTLEAHELYRRKTEQPQPNGAGSGDPNPGGTPRDLGTEPRAGSSSGALGELSAHNAKTETISDSPPAGADPHIRAEAAPGQDRPEKAVRGKDKVEK